MLRRLFIALCLLLVATPVLAADGPLPLIWWTESGGSGRSAGGSFQVYGTAGQPDAGTLRGGPFMLYGGYWHPAAIGGQTTAVTLTYVVAARSGADVQVRWGTRAELMTTGFRLDRATPCNGPRVTVGQVESQGSEGGDYSMLDSAPPLPACYILIELAGSSEAREIGRMVVGADVYLPLITRS